MASNIYKTLVEILNSNKYFVGTVSSIDATNQLSTVTLVSGDIITAKGISVAVGENCLIENGFVKQQLPTMSIYNVTI